MKNIQILLKSISQTAVGVSFFVILIILILVITGLLETFGGITFPIDKDALNLMLIVIVTIATTLYVYNSNKLEKEKDYTRRQIDLLKILSHELKFLEEHLESYKKTFSKEGTYPFYETWNIDTTLYFNGLSHKLRNRETIDLKKNLMIIKDKILLINNMGFESKKLEERGNEKLVRYRIKGLRENIIVRIDEEILPVIRESKKLINNFF